jgi:hypothetical protein
METATTLRKEPKIMLAACVDRELIERIDAMRGQVPRSRIIGEFMTHFVNEMEKSENAIVDLAYVCLSC